MGASDSGSTASLGTQLGHSLIGQIATFFSFLQLLLGFTEFGQVEGGDLLGLLNLPLVGFDLLLQLVDQILHPLVVLPVLLRLEGKLLDAALGLAQVLLGIGVAALFSVKLLLQLADALLELLDGLLASLEGVALGLVQADLGVREEIQGVSDQSDIAETGEE